jgi:hypothetical protein
LILLEKARWSMLQSDRDYLLRGCLFRSLEGVGCRPFLSLPGVISCRFFVDHEFPKFQ